MDEDALALQTLSSLSSRLARIEHSLIGTTTTSPTISLHAAKINHRDHSIKARLSALDAALSRLAQHSKPVKELLHLHASFPEIFADVLPAQQSPSSPGGVATSLLTIEEKLAIVLASTGGENGFQATASRLVALRDAEMGGIPDVESSVRLIGLQGRIDRVGVMQEVQGREMAELRRRSLKVLERWYGIGVEGVNECFAEWDERVGKVERGVKRRAKMQE